MLFNKLLKNPSFSIFSFFSLFGLFGILILLFIRFNTYIFSTIIPSLVSFMLYPLHVILSRISSDFAQSLFCLATFLSSINFLISSGISVSGFSFFNFIKCFFAFSMSNPRTLLKDLQIS